MPRIRYIGNPNTKEFHSIKKLKPECNVKDPAHHSLARFSTQKEAVAAGYDACGKRCVIRTKSRDNK